MRSPLEVIWLSGTGENITLRIEKLANSISEPEIKLSLFNKQKCETETPYLVLANEPRVASLLQVCFQHVNQRLSSFRLFRCRADIRIDYMKAYVTLEYFHH